MLATTSTFRVFAQDPGRALYGVQHATNVALWALETRLCVCRLQAVVMDTGGHTFGLLGMLYFAIIPVKPPTTQTRLHYVNAATVHIFHA